MLIVKNMKVMMKAKKANNVDNPVQMSFRATSPYAAVWCFWFSWCRYLWSCLHDFHSVSLQHIVEVSSLPTSFTHRMNVFTAFSINRQHWLGRLLDSRTWRSKKQRQFPESARLPTLPGHQYQLLVPWHTDNTGTIGLGCVHRLWPILPVLWHWWLLATKTNSQVKCQHHHRPKTVVDSLIDCPVTTLQMTLRTLLSSALVCTTQGLGLALWCRCTSAKIIFRLRWTHLVSCSKIHDTIFETHSAKYRCTWSAAVAYWRKCIVFCCARGTLLATK